MTKLCLEHLGSTTGGLVVQMNTEGYPDKSARPARLAVSSRLQQDGGQCVSASRRIPSSIACSPRRAYPDRPLPLICKSIRTPFVTCVIAIVAAERFQVHGASKFVFGALRTHLEAASRDLRQRGCSVRPTSTRRPQISAEALLASVDPVPSKSHFSPVSVPARGLTASLPSATLPLPPLPWFVPALDKSAAQSRRY